MMANIYDDREFFEAYAGMSRSLMGLDGAGEWHAMKGLFPDVRGKRLLDLGCGYGWHCRYAADMGAERVLGIDASERMIARAAEINAHAAIEYRVCDLMEYEYPEAEFDAVVSNLVLHYVANLDAVYAGIHRTLRSGGVFLMNIEHPVFTSGVGQEWVRDAQGRPAHWPVDGYYYPGERQTVFLGRRVAKQHHTLTQILMGLIGAGFALEAVVEAQPDPEMMDKPGMADEMRRPMMLLVRAQKA